MIDNLELDPYGKKCFEAGRVAARLEGITKGNSFAKIILKHHESYMTRIPLATTNGAYIIDLQLFAQDDELLVVCRTI